MKRCRKCGKGTCIFAAVMLFLGIVMLCCFSYKILLFVIAAVFIVIGIILIRRC